MANDNALKESNALEDQKLLYKQSLVADLQAAKEYHRTAAQAVKFWTIQAIAASLVNDRKARLEIFELFGLEKPRADFSHTDATTAAIEMLEKYQDAEFKQNTAAELRLQQTNALHALFTLPHIKGHINYGNDGQFFTASEIRRNLREAFANRDDAGKKLNEAIAQYRRVKDLLASENEDALYQKEELDLQQRNQERNTETKSARILRMKRIARQAVALRVQAEKVSTTDELRHLNVKILQNRNLLEPDAPQQPSKHPKKSKFNLITIGKMFSVVLSAVFGFQAFSYSAVTLFDLGASFSGLFFPIIFGTLAVQNFYQAYKHRKDRAALRKHLLKGIGFLALGALGTFAMMMSFGTGVYLIAGIIGVATFVGNGMVLFKYIPELLQKTFGKRFGKVSPTNTFIYDYENGVALGWKRKLAIVLGLFLCLTAGFVYGGIGYVSVMYSPLKNFFFAWFTFAITFVGICGLGLQNIKIELFTRDFNHWKQRWGVLFDEHFNTIPKKIFLAVVLAGGLALGVAFTTFASLPLMQELMPLTIAYCLIASTVLGKTAFYARNICFGAAEVLQNLFKRNKTKKESEQTPLNTPIPEAQPLSENVESAKQTLRLVNAIGVGATAYVGADSGLLLSSSAGIAATFSSWATASREIHPNLIHKNKAVPFDNIKKDGVDQAEHPPTLSTENALNAAEQAHEKQSEEQHKLIAEYKSMRPRK
jgi:hypothetical protein